MTESSFDHNDNFRFTDAVYNGPFRTSLKAQDAMRRLAKQWKLEYNQNPGGAEFRGTDTSIHCQITLCDDVADFEKLEQAILVYLSNHGLGPNHVLSDLPRDAGDASAGT